MLNVSILAENTSFQEIVLKVQGSLDSSSSWDFYDYIKDQELKGFRKFILDFSALDSISSSGISVLFRLKKIFQESNSSMVLTNMSPEVKELFQFFGFHRIFLMSPDRDSAEKLLESIYFLKEKRTETESIHVNRFGLVDEENHKTKIENPEPITRHGERISEVTEVVHFGDDSKHPEEDLEEIIDEFETIPHLDEVPFGDTETEPFLDTLIEEHIKSDTKSEVSIPFVTKSFGNSGDGVVFDSVIIEALPGNEEFNPLLVNCSKCGIKMKITRQGIHKCPQCSAKFNLRQSGSISTIQKL
jgi:anti-anti-sigma factor